MKTALRSLRRYPGTSLLAIVVLAVGLGASMSAFALLYNIALKPLPYPDSHQLVDITSRSLRDGTEIHTGFSVDLYQRIAERAQSFQSISLRTSSGMLPPRPYPIVANVMVSVEIADVLGIQPLLGRWFRPEEFDAVVVSHAFWSRDLGADENIIGRRLQLERPYTIVGVMPSGLDWAKSAWRLLRPSEADIGGAWPWARLAEGVSLAQAQAEMRLLSRQLADEHPDYARLELQLTPLFDRAVLTRQRTLLFLILGGGACLLALCVANIVLMLTVRAGQRSGDWAVRRFLGASRLRLIRHQLTENLVLVLPGVVAGLWIAAWAPALILDWLPELPRQNEVQLNSVVMATAVAVSAAITLICATVPLILQRDAGLDPALRGESAISGGRRRQRLQAALVTSEIAVALMLLIAGTMMFRTLVNIHNVDVGFRKSGLYTVRLEPATRRLAGIEEDLRRIAEQLPVLVEQIRRLPAVESAALSTRNPLRGFGRSVVIDRGRERSRVDAVVQPVGADYFATLQIPVLGRVFDRSDGRGGAPTAIVSREFTARYFDGQSPLGRTVTTGGADRIIVGVAEDVLNRGIRREADPTVYTPLAQMSNRPHSAVVVVATDRPAGLRDRLAALVENSGQPIRIGPVLSVDDLIRSDMQRSVAISRLLTLLSAIGLILSVGGAFGLTSFSTQSRLREFGIRQACGADRSDLVRLVLAHGGRMLLLGLPLGALASFWVGRSLENYVFGVEATDPTSVAIASAALAVAVIAACWLPARRASRMHPMEALRYE